MSVSAAVPEGLFLNKLGSVLAKYNFVSTVLLPGKDETGSCVLLQWDVHFGEIKVSDSALS